MKIRTALLACLAGVAAAGCTDPLTKIDRDLGAVLDRRTIALGGSARNPSEDLRYPAPERLSSDLDSDIDTRNPDASELSWIAADPDRDVAERLNRYASLTPGATQQDANEGEPATGLGITDVFRLGQGSARDFRFAEETYLLAAISLLIERHLWSPRFFNDTSATLSDAGVNGDFSPALDLINTLRTTQRLPFGGDVEASWVTRATQQLRERVTDRYEQSSELVLSADIPLLRGAGQVAREDRIQAERNLIFAARAFERFRRVFLVDIATDYFSLLNQQAQIRNQERQIDSLVGLEEQTAELVRAGRQSAFRTNIVSSQVLTARANLASLRESYIFALDRFKVRLGLDPATRVKLLPLDLEVTDPDIPLDEAAALAIAYRLDLQTEQDRISDARRGVANSRNALLPDLDFSASVGLPTDPNTDGMNFDTDFFNYAVGVTLGLPLDRQIERLNVRAAVIGFERARRSFDELRDEIIIAARAAAREVELARFQLQLAELDVEINEQRLREQELKADEIDAQTRVDTENDLLDAQNARDQAATDLRIAVLEYLLATGTLRVDDEGLFQPPPGLLRNDADESDGANQDPFADEG
ncbi:MAG: TolC family protein [Planctomycetota bacterium]